MDIKSELEKTGRSLKLVGKQGTWDVDEAADGTLNVRIGYEVTINVDTPGDSEKAIVAGAKALKSMFGGNAPQG